MSGLSQQIHDADEAADSASEANRQHQPGDLATENWQSVDMHDLTEMIVIHIQLGIVITNAFLMKSVCNLIGVIWNVLHQAPIFGVNIKSCHICQPTRGFCEWISDLQSHIEISCECCSVQVRSRRGEET
jgi:hypothetical protein